MPLVHAVAGDDEQRVADDQRRAGRQVVREDAQLLHHVEPPDHVAVGLAVVLLVLHAAVAGGQPVRAEAEDLAAVGDDPEAVALDDGAGADALVRPVVDAAGLQLVADVLPEELAVDSSKHIRTPLSPVMSGSARLLLLVPTKILPPETMGPP